MKASMRMPFGKHRDACVAVVVDTDIKYALWLLSQPSATTEARCPLVFRELRWRVAEALLRELEVEQEQRGAGLM